MTKKTKSVLIKTVAIVLTLGIITGAVLLGLYFGTQKTPSDFLEKQYSGEFTDKLNIVDKTDRYLAHPDLVQTDKGRLLVVYPAGHGRGQILMKYSDDFGKTWSERRTDLPASWANSQETPTIYNLHFTNGKSKLILVSGCPHWSAGVRDGEYLPEMQANGFNFSYSDDDGDTWSEFENFYSPMNCIVAMSSLTQLKENGKYVDKWMGTFHDAEFINYKTILTFDENGKANWSTPEPLLAEHRAVEKKMGICEIEIIRNVENDCLILLARAEERVTRSAISVSYDEGNTWTEPKETPYILSGDRHKAEYDEASGKVVMSFRQIIPAKPNILSTKDTIGDGWVGWIGTFSDLMKMATEEGTAEGNIYLFGKHYGAWCDSGYNGVVCKDGKALLVTYGQFTEDAENPYIVSLEINLIDADC